MNIHIYAHVYILICIGKQILFFRLFTSGEMSLFYISENRSPFLTCWASVWKTIISISKSDLHIRRVCLTVILVRRTCPIFQRGVFFLRHSSDLMTPKDAKKGTSPGRGSLQSKYIYLFCMVPSACAESLLTPDTWVLHSHIDLTNSLSTQSYRSDEFLQHACRALVLLLRPAKREGEGGPSAIALAQALHALATLNYVDAEGTLSRVCVRVCVRVWVCLCVCVGCWRYALTCVCVHMCVCVSVNYLDAEGTPSRVCVCVCVCICVCVWVWITWMLKVRPGFNYAIAFLL